MHSFTFDSSGEAYDASQTREDIKDGDILLVPSEGRAAVLVRAWPISALGTTDPGAFHQLDTDQTWPAFDDGKYESSAVVAIALATIEGLKAAGLPTFIGDMHRMLTIARQYGWEKG